jgi:hypothetical protein
MFPTYDKSLWIHENSIRIWLFKNFVWKLLLYFVLIWRASVKYNIKHYRLQVWCLQILLISLLPIPPKWTLIDIQNIFFQFLWNNKWNKDKRKIIMTNNEKGELKLPHIESYCCALKIYWIHKLLLWPFSMETLYKWI